MTPAIDIRRIAEWLKNPAIPESERQELTDIAAADRDASGVIDSAEFSAQFPKSLIVPSEIERQWKAFQFRFGHISSRQDWRLVMRDAREAGAICGEAQQAKVVTTQTLSATVFCDHAQMPTVVRSALEKLPQSQRPQTLYSCGTAFLNYLASAYAHQDSGPSKGFCSILYPNVPQSHSCFFWGLLQDPNAEIRALATRSIGPTPDPQVQHDLLLMMLAKKHTDSFYAIAQINQLPPKYRTDIVRLGFESFCGLAASQVQNLLPEERLDMLKFGLQHERSDCAANAIAQLKYLTLAERLSLLQSSGRLADSGANVPVALLDGLEHLPLVMRLGMVQKGLTSEHYGVRQTAIAQVRHLPIMDRLALVQNTLTDSREWVGAVAIRQIPHLPIPDRLALVQAGLKDDRLDVRRSAVEQIQHLYPSDRLDLVEVALDDGDWEVRSNGLGQVPYLAPTDRLGPVETGLKDDDYTIRRVAIALVPTLVPADRLAVVKTALQDEKSDVRFDAIRQAEYLSSSDRRQVCEQGLKDSELFVRNAAKSLVATSAAK